jgi:plasmid stabilization system protein ParE
MQEYRLVFSKSFKTSLENTIDEWENELLLSPESIRRFVRTIQKALELTKTFPKMYEEVSQIYGMEEETYRLMIGKSYAIFYRINEEKKTIHVGQLFLQKQMKLDV